MASLHLVKGLYRITWSEENDRKGIIRLGLPADQKKTADVVHYHVGALLAARDGGALPKADTLAWVNGLSDKLHKKLARWRLVEPRQAAEVVTLGQLWTRFLAAKAVKPATTAIYSRVRSSLEDRFGSDRPITAIGAEQAEGWCKSLADDGLAPATRSKYIHIAKALFRRAVLWDLLTRNPFESIRPGPQSNPKRQAYIPAADIERVLEAAGSHDWRCIFGLTRLAGLRCPSEIVGLRWGDVDFEARTMIVTSPKTEHHADGATRVVPIVPRLHDVLMAAFTAAEPGTVHVVPRLRQADTNLRTHAHRIFHRAGLEPPPKLFVNLRASCATDWAREHGGHVAAKWCGHSPLIALRHYAQVRPEDFQRATGRLAGGQDKARPEAHQKAHPQGREPANTDGKRSPKTPANQAENALVAAGSGDKKWAQQDSNL